jgi:hypothetical protein
LTGAFVPVTGVFVPVEPVALPVVWPVVVPAGGVVLAGGAGGAGGGAGGELGCTGALFGWIGAMFDGRLIGFGSAAASAGHVSNSRLASRTVGRAGNRISVMIRHLVPRRKCGARNTLSG